MSSVLCLAFIACSNGESKQDLNNDKSKEGETIETTENNESQTSQTATSAPTPIQELFSSMDNLKTNFVGMDYVSSDNTCVIDMRRDTRYKIFIKENGDWKQFDGTKYRTTYNSENKLCVEFEHMEMNGSQEKANAIFTPEKLILTYKNGKALEFNDFRITTSDEAGSIIEG